VGEQTVQDKLESCTMARRAASRAEQKRLHDALSVYLVPEQEDGNVRQLYTHSHANAVKQL